MSTVFSNDRITGNTYLFTSFCIIFFLLSKRIKDHFQNHFVGLCGSMPKFCTVITFKPLHFSALGLWLGSIVQLLQRNFLLRILFFPLLFLYPYLKKKIQICHILKRNFLLEFPVSEYYLIQTN